MLMVMVNDDDVGLLRVDADGALVARESVRQRGVVVRRHVDAVRGHGVRGSVSSPAAASPSKSSFSSPSSMAMPRPNRWAAPWTSRGMVFSKFQLHGLRPETDLFQNAAYRNVFRPSRFSCAGVHGARTG